MPTFLLEVLYLFPKVLRDLSCSSGSMKRLRQPVLMQELLHFSLILLFGLKLSVDDLLKLLLDLNLHTSDLRRHDMAELVLNLKLALQVLHDRL